MALARPRPDGLAASAHHDPELARAVLRALDVRPDHQVRLAAIGAELADLEAQRGRGSQREFYSSLRRVPRECHACLAITFLITREMLDPRGTGVPAYAYM